MSYTACDGATTDGFGLVPQGDDDHGPDGDSGADHRGQAADPATFDQVWQEYFEQRDTDARRKTAWWVRVVGAIMAFAVLVSAVTAAVQAIRYLTRISEPDAIVEYAQSYVDESPFGFLVTGIEAVPIEPPKVGAFVRANPADGIVTIDIRPWEGPGLDRIMAHEIGHLIDFALFESQDRADASLADQDWRGGLSSEVWAECAAVAADTRNLDDSSSSKEYRCTPDELHVFESVMEQVDELCVPWRSDTPCWTIDER